VSYCVYLHVSPSGKKYVGITGIEPEKRWQNGLGYRRNAHFTKAIKKYGWSTFDHIVLYRDLDKESAESVERHLIAWFSSNDRERGYNITSGGECIGKHSEETKRLMREKLKGRPPTRLGAKASEETRARQSVAATIRNKKRGICEMAEQNKRRIRCRETGAEYEAISYAARECGVSVTAISNACRGVRPTAAGYHWEYLKEGERVGKAV